MVVWCAACSACGQLVREQHPQTEGARIALDVFLLSPALIPASPDALLVIGATTPCAHTHGNIYTGLLSLRAPGRLSLIVLATLAVVC